MNTKRQCKGTAKISACYKDFAPSEFLKLTAKQTNAHNGGIGTVCRACRINHKIKRKKKELAKLQREFDLIDIEQRKTIAMETKQIRQQKLAANDRTEEAE